MSWYPKPLRLPLGVTLEVATSDCEAWLFVSVSRAEFRVNLWGRGGWRRIKVELETRPPKDDTPIY